MTLITRHILYELLKVYLITLSAITSVIILTDMVDQLQQRWLGIGQIAFVLPYLLPHGIRIGTQGAILFAVCNVYGRMSAANEILAVKSLGISPLRVLWPAWIFSFLLSLMCVWLYDAGEGWGHRGVQRVCLEFADEIVYQKLRTQKSVEIDGFSISVKGVEGRKLIRPVMTLTTSDQNTVVTVAQEGDLRLNPQTNQLRISLRTGTVTMQDKFQMSFRDTITQDVPVPQDYSVKEVNHARLAQHQGAIDFLARELAACETQLARGTPLPGPSVAERRIWLDNAHREMWRLRAHWHHKWANSFGCLFFAMIGAPLSILLRSADYKSVFFICFLPVVLVYNPMIHLGKTLAYTGSMPSQGVWLCNALLAGGSLWLLKKIWRR